MARLDGKVAIITGGESGIGRASAGAMVDEGERGTSSASMPTL